MYLVLCLGVAICWALCVSLETVKLICFVVFGDGWGAGWVVFLGLLVLGSSWHAGYSLTLPTKSMKNKFMKIVRTQGWVMGHGSRT